MPERVMLMGVSEVVWGVTDQPNGTPYTMDFGDGTAVINGNVVDRSYIHFNHAYATSGTFTATLNVGTESATVDVQVHNPALLTDAQLRGVNVNRTIENGLRYLWSSQVNRAAGFPAAATTNWGGTFPGSYASLIVLAFENHGYQLPNNDGAPTGVYQKYIVQRGLNYVLDNLETLTLTAQAAGDPCAGGFGPAPCTGLMLAQEISNFHQSYETGIGALALAGSGALSRTVAGIPGTSSGGAVVGMSYGDVLQSMVNALAFGQIDNPSFSFRNGGWYYNFNGFSSDGSTVGWVLLALFDAAAAGVEVPAFVKNEWANGALPGAINTNGSFDYQGDGNAASNSAINVAKAGVGLQGMAFAGRPNTDQDVQDALGYIDARWNTTGFISGDSFICGNQTWNKGCGYGMFNVFKGLKLLGVGTLPSVNRPAGSVGDADDWHADYIDWLVANQTNPTSPTGGQWANAGVNNLVFSSQVAVDPAEAALAELILAPVALVLPDPTLFSTVGLSPATATNPVGTTHTVTAEASSANQTPVPAATVNFEVLTGPNAGKTGSDTTDANGQATFTYTDTGGPGTDTIQAFIGNLGSNIVEKIWEADAMLVCDVNTDGQVDSTDIQSIFGRLRSPAGPDDPADLDGDGLITINDARGCVLQCTNPNCAPN